MGAEGKGEHGLGPGLREREEELTALHATLDGARAGFGGTSIIRGPPGIGKTRLLQELRDHARESGLVTLAAWGSEAERPFAFGCVRQLFDQPLREHDAEELLAGDAGLAEPVFAPPADADPDSPSPDPGFGVLHGLYWLTVNLAERAPLLLALDDAHWADPASLRFLSFLSRRLEGVPGAVALATRPAAPGLQPLPGDLTGGPTTEIIELGPLSAEAVAEIVHARLNGSATPELLAACHEATGGNPFLLRELLREIGDGTVEISPDQVIELGPERVAEAVLTRIAGAGPEAVELANAVAVLGDWVELHRAATLAGLEPIDAAGAFERLVAADVLERGSQLAFVHPIVRNAVYRGMPEAMRATMHGDAVALLGGAGEPAEAVAAHALATHPEGDVATVRLLQEAARVASARGAPDGAVRYLERALAEPPPPEVQPGLMLALGSAAGELSDPRALTWLEQAIKLAPDRADRDRAANALGNAIAFAGGADQLIEIGRRYLADDEGEPAEGGTLARWMIRLSQVSPSTREAGLETSRRNLAAALAGEELPGEALASASFEAVLTNGTADQACAIAERALPRIDEFSREPEAVMVAIVLALGERLDEAAALLDRMVEDARAQGDLPAYAAAVAIRVVVRYRQGRVADARGDADLYPSLMHPAITDLVLVGGQLEALADAGELEAAEQLAASMLELGVDRDLLPYQCFAYGVGKLRFAQGDHAGAIGVVSSIAAWEQRTGMASGIWNPWRLVAALSHAELGERERALELADEQLELATRFDRDGVRGSALRVRGLVVGGDRGLEDLAAAVEALTESPLKLERARALVDHGAALRRAKRGEDAREALRRGLELARDCRADALADRALDEYVSAGGRPRRAAKSDFDTLTPTEVRVAELAAEGMSNKEIAQARFVTVKTVETHLGRAFSKLGISSRSQLASRLGER